MKVVLAYSGGLDTSVALNWLQKCYDAEVITFTAEIGQSKDLKAIEEKAKKHGAVKTNSVDLRKELAEGYILPAIKANGLYQGAYPLICPLSRPLIAKKIVEVAKKEGADAVAHGSTAKGNDQVRFDASFMVLGPGLKIIAPAREWGMSRPQLVEYAKEHDIPLESVPQGNYAIDENLWGLSIEGGDLEHPWDPHTSKPGITYPESGPDKAESIEITFISGKPVGLNGKKIELVQLIEELNKKGKQHGVGVIDHMEDRVIGLKSREVYQCPAAEILIKAHKDLEKLVSTGHQNHFKQIIDQKWAEIVYSGLWFDPLKENLDAYIDLANKKVSGKVKVKLYKGNATVVGRSSPHAIYMPNLITYGNGDEFDHFAAEHFIKFHAMPTKIAAMVHKGDGKDDKAMGK